MLLGIHPGLFIYCAVNVFISIIARSYSMLQDMKDEEEQQANAAYRQQVSGRAGSNVRGRHTDNTPETEFLGRATVSDRLASNALDLFGSIANSLAEDDDPDLIAPPRGDGVHSSPSTCSAPSRALELESMSSGSESEVAMLRGQCLEIVSVARGELLQALENMDRQLAALGLDASRSTETAVGGPASRPGTVRGAKSRGSSANSTGPP
eukprot:COSAG03_NODE_437_length_7919_cov_5.570332_5_plen_209_part_00